MNQSERRDLYDFLALLAVVFGVVAVVLGGLALYFD